MARITRFSFLNITAALLILLAGCELVAAQQVNSTSTPAGSEKTQNEDKLVRWRAGPKGRGTFSLLVSCLVTLFLCVWTTVQVNIEPKNSLNTFFSALTGWKWKWMEKLLAKRWVRKSGWSLISLVFPEMTLAVAIYENRTAWILKKKMSKIEKRKREEKAEKEKKNQDGNSKVQQKIDDMQAEDQNRSEKRWSGIALAYFVVMGGFKVQVRREPKQAQAQVLTAEDDNNSDSIQSVNSAKAGTSAQREHKVVEDKNDEHNEERPPETLTPYGAIFLAGKEAFQTKLDSDQIRDRSKAGVLAKVIVVLQALSMAVQVLCRTAARLQVSLLEVHVILHVLCSLCMYIIWWGKPVDIELQEIIFVSPDVMKDLKEAKPLEGGIYPTNPTNLFAKRVKRAREGVKKELQDGRQHETTEADVEANRNTQERKNRDPYLTTRAGLGKALYEQLCGGENILKNYFLVIFKAFGRLIHSGNKLWKEALFVTIVAMVYGGAHLATWNNQFPTEVEKWMWRVSSMVTAVSVGYFVLCLYVGSLLKLSKMFTGKRGILYILLRWIGGIGVAFGILLGVFARIFLLVECFIALRAVPEETYQTVAWAETWPNFG